MSVPGWLVFSWVVLVCVPPLLDDYGTFGDFCTWAVLITVVWAFACGVTAAASALGWLGAPS